MGAGGPSSNSEEPEWVRYWTRSPEPSLEFAEAIRRPAAAEAIGLPAYL